MRLRKFCCLASAVALSSLTVFSAMSGVIAEAASLSVELTPVETLALYGGSIEAVYCAYTDDFRQTTFDYVGTVTDAFSADKNNANNFLGSDVRNVLSTYGVANTYTYLVYRCEDVAYSDSSIQFQFQLTPKLDLQASSISSSLFFSVASGNSNLNYQNYKNIGWSWSFNDEETLFQPNYNNNSYHYMDYFTIPAGGLSFDYGSNVSDSYFCGIPVKYLSDEPAHIVSGNITILRSSPVVFSDDSSAYYLFVQCPIVSDDYVIIGGSGSGSGGGSSSPDINVDVNVDMSETNGLLGKLLEAFQGFVSGILEGIKNLFVPSEEALTGFQTDMQAALSEHLGGLYEALEVITDSFSGLGDVVARETLYVPETVIPLVDSSFTIGPWEIPLKVDDNRFSFVYESVAFIIDFIFTAAFVNMLRNKLEIFLNPESEVITE